MYGLAEFDDGTGPALYTSGVFVEAGAIGVNNIAKWGCVRGDLNCDGVVNAFDIEPFLLALFDPDEYSNQYPDCDINLADINGDGTVDAFDIEPFLDLLFEGGSACDVCSGDANLDGSIDAFDIEPFLALLFP